MLIITTGTYSIYSHRPGLYTVCQERNRALPLLVAEYRSLKQARVHYRRIADLAAAAGATLQTTAR